MPAYQNQQLFIYNSLSGEKEIFQPLIDGYVGMYVCGPTVYSNVHLGNCRTFISFDLIFRYLKHLGYKVRYVRNITDAGHLENDADSGEDRIAKKARLEQIEPMEVVQRYTVDFHQTLSRFNTLPPSVEPTATGHIVEQIGLVQKILDAGYAYEVNGSVYFDVLKFNQSHNYGKLSKRKVEDLIHNTRDLDGQNDKRNPQDFALWKKAEPQHIMRWPSPWSDGFPGWHLECTAMSTKYLGEQFDIHGGGMDLKFPHHECEIAQAEARYGKDPVRYWMHANMLILNGRKMAKSTGNFILPNEMFSGENDILSKAFSPMVVRFFMLQAHYRSVLDLSSGALEASEKGFIKLMQALRNLSELKPVKKSSWDVHAWRQRCYDAMNDDFNSPQLIAELFEGLSKYHHMKEKQEGLEEQELQLYKDTMYSFVQDVLGLQDETHNEQDLSKLDGVMEILIRLRKQVRSDKNFGLSDQIRDELLKIGIQLKDGKDGTTYDSY